ncbi:MAG: hypothetical protein NT062_37055 [Proteobacteria bacterium]|nr:hypothetical protein [Pseudomonadota bacterium]
MRTKLLVLLVSLAPASALADAPYARVFEQGQAWTFLASTSTNTQQHQRKVTCRVAEVSTMCDRTVSEVTCDDEAQVLTGTYVTTGRGMWRVEGEPHQSLADNQRALARYPERFVDGAGKPIATAYRGGWCTSSTTDGVTRTICLSEQAGFLGGAITRAGTRVVVGDVPATTTTTIAAR